MRTIALLNFKILLQGGREYSSNEAEADNMNDFVSVEYRVVSEEG